jgi:uncharacterized protein DUF4011
MTPSDRLEALRERLLDLTFRNRLLNHSDLGRRILKVRRVALGELYQLLVEESKLFHLERVAGNDPEEGKEGGGRKLRVGLKAYRYTIRHDGEDVSSNLALILRLRRAPFSLELR